MIDFHSHILPGLDDGSKSVEESLGLLNMLSEQGVKNVVATPHFIANDESVVAFLERRKESFEKLKALLNSEIPQIILGVEVKYYQGISMLEGLQELCIENSNLLLLEMPMCRWTEYIINELTNIALNSNITVVLAHVERFLAMQTAKTLRKLEDCGILLQVNAEFIINRLTRRKALRMIGNQMAQLIGSDCHNLSERPPNIGKAFRLIEKKYGKDFVDDITDYGNDLLFNNR